MKGFVVVALAAACVLLAAGCSSGRYATHASGSGPDSLGAMTKQDVIALSKAGLGNSVIIGMINKSGSTFRLRTPDVIALADSGVADTVIHAMLQADKTSQSESLAAANGSPLYDYYWWWGNPYYDPWYWSWGGPWPGPYYGVRVLPGFHGGRWHR